MGRDILNELSPNELDKEIQAHVSKDQRALPMRSKVFAAIAKIQQFDRLPEIVEINDLNEVLKDKDYVELNRGLSSTKGVTSQFYAKELFMGAMYPGTLSALGNGIYFAVPSKKDDQFLPTFPLISVVALKYTEGETAGIVLRAALKKGSKVADCDGLKQYLRENRNRAKRAGITDLGAFAAALGIDAFHADGLYDDTDERVYTVLNRGALLLQKRGILVKSVTGGG
jgi:hypothetical protein